MPQETLPVAIAGGGPAGLACAVALAQQNVPLVLFEREPDLPRHLRAGVFHPPTLQMLDRLGVGADFRAIGIETRVWQHRDRDTGVVAEFDMAALSEDTPYPFRLHCEQHKLTPLLLGRLRGFSRAEVHFLSEVLSVEDKGSHAGLAVTVEGREQQVAASYVLGADGARSVVRKSAGIAFEGLTWPERYLVASTAYDLGKQGFAPACYVSDPREWCAMMQMPSGGGPGLWRLCFPIPEDMSDEAAVEESFVRGRLTGFAPYLDGCPLDHVNLYKVHQRVAGTMAAGRLLLAGDAAHLNNPLGGMGVNSAIHDVMNLAARLGPIWHGQEMDPQASLAQYSRQRRKVTVDYVQSMSIRNKKLMEETDPAIRADAQAELRATAADPAATRKYLRRTSLIDSLETAAATA